MRRQRVPEKWEPGALCRAIWSGDPTTSAAAWRELGRQAAEDGWARRLLFDVIEGKLFLPPDAAVPGLRALAEVNAEMVLALLRSGSATNAHVAATALGQEGGKFLSELLRLTQETEVTARLAGVAGLAEAAAAGSLEAVEALGARVQDPAGVVRRAATIALGRARGGDCAGRAAYWLSRATGRGDETTLAAAAFGAAALWPARGRDAVRMLRRLADAGPSVRRAVAVAMRGLPRRAAAQIADLCLRDGDPDVRALTAGALYRWAGEGSGPARRDLERLSRDAHPRVRAAAAELLVGDPKLGTLPVVRRLATDRSAIVRSAVADVLGRRGGDDACDILCEMAKDSYVTTRAAAIRSLGALGGQAEVEDACFDTEPLVRAAAAQALASAEHACPLLMSLCDDKDTEVRRAAARGLGRCGCTRVGPVWDRLMELATNEALSGAVAEAVAAAFASDPGWCAGVVFWWPESDRASQQMWQIAKAARTSGIAEMARAAARLFDPRTDLGVAWHDAAVGWSVLGQPGRARVASWLGDCARASTLEDIARMHVTIPGVGGEAVVLLAGVSRAVVSALRVRSPEARERQVGRVLARIDALLEMKSDRAGWRRVHEIGRKWRAVLEGMRASSGLADVSARLLSAQIVAGLQATVLVEIENAGKGTAHDLSWHLNESRARAADLPAGARAELAITIGATRPGTLALRGSVKFRDREGRREAGFEGQVEALDPGDLRPAANPYVVGKPLGGQSPMFFGRAAEIAYVERALASGENGSVVVLVGQRRTGKTSLLRRVEARLADQYRPVFIDVQGMLPSDTGDFFSELAYRALGSGEAVPMLADGDASRIRSSAGADMVREVADRSDKRMVLLLDEFDDLEAKVRSRRLSEDVFAQLRNLMQHSENVSLVLSGTHRLEALAGEYWSFLLNLATYRRVGCLPQEEAEDVLRVPLGRLGIVWEDAAVARAVRLAGRQPYLLQLLGYRLVEQCVESGEAAVRTDTVEKAAKEVAEQGEIHLRYLWDSAGAEGQLVLRALSTSEEGLTMDELETVAQSSPARLSKALGRLSELELVDSETGRSTLRIGLLGHWLKGT